MKQINPWIYVILTCALELAWVYGFNKATLWWHWPPLTGIIILDFYFLTKACEQLPTGTVYAMFAGVGTAGTALMDALLFDKTFSKPQLFFITVLLVGVIWLKLADMPKKGGAK